MLQYMATDRRRYTNKSIHWRGDTVVVSARVPRPVAEIIDASIGLPGLPDKSSVIQDALAVWALLEERTDGDS